MILTKLQRKVPESGPKDLPVVFIGDKHFVLEPFDVKYNGNTRYGFICTDFQNTVFDKVFHLFKIEFLPQQFTP